MHITWLCCNAVIVLLHNNNKSCPITFAVTLSPVTPSLYLIVAVCYRLILSRNTKHALITFIDVYTQKILKVPQTCAIYIL